jgi:Subtilase family
LTHGRDQLIPFEAINWAVTQWNVDIVSMSFGFSKEMPDISRAIRHAVADTDDAILFFAAAGNDGGNGGEMFPANHTSVISIRGTDSQGYFLKFNPPRNRHETVVYGTLATDVPSAWLRDHPGEMHKSGTSVATAIAAGIAAILLGYISGKPPGTVEKRLEKRLRSQRGMWDVFEIMGKDMGNGCSYLNPWNFFKEEDTVCLWRIVIALS